MDSLPILVTLAVLTTVATKGMVNKDFFTIILFLLPKGTNPGPFSVLLLRRSFGYLTYEPDGSTIREKITDLALLLTAGRMGDVHLNAIEQACSPEVDHASIMRCAQQLIVTTGEFHSTNRVLPSGADRTTSSKPRRINSEPYKAIVYLQVGGGLDSFNMLVPYTCSPIDVYNKYRMIRGKNENSEGVGLPIERLLEIQSNNSDQPCTSFGIHENLTVLKDLYDHQGVIFIANAGLLAKSVDMSNYEVEAPGGLFSHDTMTLQTAREDLAGKYSGTGKCHSFMN